MVEAAARVLGDGRQLGGQATHPRRELGRTGAGIRDVVVAFREAVEEILKSGQQNIVDYSLLDHPTGHANFVQV